MISLIENINNIVSLEDDEKKIIAEHFEITKLKKGDFFITEGKVCQHIAFLETGKLRVHYDDVSGNEVTCYFVTENNFISSFTSFLTETPTRENISAIENSTLYVISKSALESLSLLVPKIHIWRRIVAENLFIMMEKRTAALQSQTANERYEQMIKESPDILLSVPLQYTASFLGISPQHLSRIRKELSK